MDRHERIRNLFDCAMEQSPSIRERFLRSLLPGEDDLLEELLSLIKAHQRAPAVLDEPLVNFGRDAAMQLPQPGTSGTPIVKPGLRIGAYRLTRPIGAGGLSTVWLAERVDGRFEYRVAVKLLGLCHSPALAKRFRTEQRALASLQHPYIARLIDAGNTESGVPYFIMEYIEGEPIDAFCRTQNLSINERLQLFLKVCEAVNYAHRKMVAHRDLKPNNILVETEGRPRLLDFGIAKLLRPQGSLPLRSDSSTGLRAFTPDYASPEQWQGGPMTHATDIYSLGVVLYELLAGCRLSARYERKGADLSYVRVEPIIAPSEAFLRQLAQVDENRPQSSGTSGAQNGRFPYPETDASERKRIHGQLCGDIDVITLKAVAFRPQDRYESVERFADDIRRYLDNRPIRARRCGLFYRTRRFIIRNRGLAAGMAVAMMGLLAAVIGATFGIF